MFCSSKRSHTYSYLWAVNRLSYGNLLFYIQSNIQTYSNVCVMFVSSILRIGADPYFYSNTITFWTNFLTLHTKIQNGTYYYNTYTVYGWR